MAYCVNGTWTASGKIGAGTDTPGLGFTAQGSAVGDAAIQLKNTSVNGQTWSIYSTGTNFSQGYCNLIFYREGVDGANAAVTFDWGGHVGIGTYAPTEMLHICQAGGSGPEIRLQNSTSSHYIRAYDNNFNILMNTACVALSIKNNGYIGMGTTSPSSKLHVYSTTSLDGLTVENTLRNQTIFRSTGEHMFMYLDSHHQCIYQPAIFFQRSSTTYAELRLQRASSSDSLGAYTESEGLIGTTGATPFSIQSNGIRRLHLASNGYVGVNNITPCGQVSLGSIINDCKLLVYDNGSVNDRYGFGIRNSQFLMYTGTAGEQCGGITFGQYCGSVFTENVRFMNNGHVGIGVVCPAYKLDVQCSIGDYLVRLYNTKTGDSAGLYVKAGSNATNEIIKGEDYSGNPRFLVGACGNVSVNAANINTTYKLYVNGAFYAAGSSCEYKQSICQYNTDSCMFMKLTPVTYQYKDEWCHLGKELKSGTQIGLIAEDVAEVYPELAILKDEEDNKVVRNVDYEKLSIVLLSEVQKLRKELDELKTK
jgi:hypothetical protein